MTTEDSQCQYTNKVDELRQREIRSLRRCQISSCAVVVFIAVLSALSDRRDLLWFALTVGGCAVAYELIIMRVRALPAHIFMQRFSKKDQPSDVDS